MKSKSAEETSRNFCSLKWKYKLELYYLLGSAFAAAVAYYLHLLKSSNCYLVCSESRNIYTVDESNPRVECMSLVNGVIVGTGDYVDLAKSNAILSLSFLPSGFFKIFKGRVIQLDPNFALVPGLADAHAHIIENGYMMQLPLKSAKSVREVIDLVNEFVLSHPEVLNDTTRWIEGMGWDHTKWPGAQFPTANDFDSSPLLKNRLISLSRIDGHSKWVSPAILKLMQNLPDDVDGGYILRDEYGNPTGIFVDKAMDFIPVPPWSEFQMSDFFHSTIKEALSFGLTSIHDADTTPDRIQFFRKLADSGELPNRLYLMGYVESEDYWADQIPRLINYGKNGFLNLRSIKIFADGTLGSWSASMLEPYSDDPTTHGLLRISPETLSQLVTRFWKDGWQTNIHGVGDRANRVILDIFEDIIENKGGNITEWRPRIEHAQIFAPDDLDRIGKLGVIASVQPTYATADMNFAEARLGSSRIKSAHAYQTLLRVSPQGVLPLGSDFPVAGVNPLLGFYAAITRLSIDGTSPHGSDGWFPEERLTRKQALKGMTLDPAYASFAEDQIGSLSPGKKADFVVFNKDIMTIPVEDILNVKVTATVIDGIIRYGTL